MSLLNLERLGGIEKGDHVFGVFQREDMNNYALNFLKTGLAKNETILFMTGSTPKSEIRKMIKAEWKIKNLEELEANQTILLKTPEELTAPEGPLDSKNSSNFWKFYSFFFFIYHCSE